VARGRRRKGAHRDGTGPVLGVGRSAGAVLCGRRRRGRGGAGGGWGAAVCVRDGGDAGELLVLGAVEAVVGAFADVSAGCGGEGGVVCQGGEGVEEAGEAGGGCGGGVV